jgi:GNAT superfamily N-acetyltransferase
MCEHGKVTIRDFKNSDLAEVRDLIKKAIDVCYSNVYCAEAVKFFKDWHHDQKILQNAEEGFSIVLEQDGRIIGTGTIVGDEIIRVFVDPVYQKRGFGKLIMCKLEKKAVLNGVDAVRLDVSLPSKKFYDSLGYVMLKHTFLELENNKRLDYYKMQKSLTKNYNGV